jgi:hypothetical protein
MLGRVGEECEDLLSGGCSQPRRRPRAHAVNLRATNSGPFAALELRCLERMRTVSCGCGVIERERRRNRLHGVTIFVGVLWKRRRPKGVSAVAGSLQRAARQGCCWPKPFERPPETFTSFCARLRGFGAAEGGWSLDLGRARRALPRDARHRVSSRASLRFRWCTLRGERNPALPFA